MEKVRFDAERGVIDRQSAEAEINPFDLNALETALRIKEECGGTVTALSMGPPRAEDVLREALARGADEGILITDRRFGGSDTYATSRTLSAAIEKLNGYDLVVAGEMSVDGDTAQVGAQTAEFLGIPHVAYVSEAESTDEKSLTVCGAVWRGTYRRRLYYPCLITVTKDINNPRLPSFKGKMAARKAEITVWSAEDLAPPLELDKIGIKGSPTQVRRIVIPPEVERKGIIFREDLDAAMERIRDILKRERVIDGAGRGAHRHGKN